MPNKEFIWQARYVVHKHNAKKAGLHYDLRIEIPSKHILWSFASRKPLPLKPGIKRLIIKQPDHELKWLNFSGEIPEGEYGAGTIRIWDKGKYKLWSKQNNKVYVLEFIGRKLKGIYVLVKMSNNNYLFFKKKK